MTESINLLRVAETMIGGVGVAVVLYYLRKLPSIDTRLTELSGKLDVQAAIINGKLDVQTEKLDSHAEQDEREFAHIKDALKRPRLVARQRGD